MKFYINRKPIEGPWGGGNLFVKSMYSFLPSHGYEIVDNPYVDVPDIIFLQSPKPDNTSRFSINDAIEIKRRNISTKIFLRVNDCDARKATSGVDEMWIATSRYVDKTFFVSSWMKNYFLQKGWQCTDNHVIYNGVDKKIFKPREKINNGKINIVTHHWSNNRMKGFDAYEFIDEFVGRNKDYTFTYIGRELGTFKNANIIEPLFGLDLAKELSKYDVYISGSKYDPGPNHILESLACKLPTIVCKDGGGAVEFTSNNVYDSLKDLENILIKNKYSFQTDIEIYSWKNCILKYSEEFKSEQ